MQKHQLDSKIKKLWYLGHSLLFLLLAAPFIIIQGIIGFIFIPFLIGMYWMWNRKRIVDGANDNLSGCYMGIAILKALRDEAQKPRKKTGHTSLVQRFESERKFWVIFFSCLPIIFVLLGAILSVFAIAFFGMIALIVLLVAALAAAVAIGSAIALIGIIYGVIQFITEGGVTAVALYEAGMGIFAAGVTMLVGVLIYNAAIRVVPFAMKKLRVLLKFVFKKLGVLTEYLKGVCAAI